MKKEDILALSRAEGKDEMEITENNRSGRWGLITLTIAGFFLMVVKFRYQGEFFFEFPLLIFAHGIGSTIYSYSKLKNRRYLFAVLANVVAFATILTIYFKDFIFYK